MNKTKKQDCRDRRPQRSKITQIRQVLLAVRKRTVGDAGPYNRVLKLSAKPPLNSFSIACLRIFSIPFFKTAPSDSLAENYRREGDILYIRHHYTGKYAEFQAVISGKAPALPPPMCPHGASCVPNMPSANPNGCEMPPKLPEIP